MRLPPPRFTILPFLAILPGVVSALEIREYSPSRHDRFVDGASGPEINSAAYYNPALYTGVGFGINPGDNRQFVLVTPEHILFAKHFSFGGVVRFLNTDGMVTDRTIGTTTNVPNGNGGTADVLIAKLSAPLGTAEKISPLPYLNLANENAYIGTVLTTFGQTRRAGRGVVRGFSNFSSTSIDQTRTFNFRYNKSFGSQNDDDAFAVGGDSGSPTFALANGNPALVGIHLAASEGTFSNSTIDTFVPHYEETINALLAPEGYQLIPAYPEAVALTSAATHDTLLQASAGTINIALSNTDADTATNVRMELEFPAEAIPTGISATGWIVENPSPGTYLLRTATLAGNASATVTASYSTIPSVAEISVHVLHRSDGSPELSQTFDLPVQSTFAGFVSALPLKGELDDPDQDGFPNLIEYAFGGDPAVNSALGSGGQPLAPTTVSENGDLIYSFLRRKDAAEIGLVYEMEFSETLEETSWSTTPPPGFSMGTDSYNPDSPSFEKVSATFPTGSPDKQFIRVKISLAE